MVSSSYWRNFESGKWHKNFYSVKSLFIISQFYPIEAGAERQAFLLARTLCKVGVWVSVITGRWTGNLPAKEYLENVRVYRNLTLGSSWKSSFMRHLSGFVYMVSLAWFLAFEGKRYNVFHVHQAFYPAFVTVIAGRLFKKPVVVKVGVGGDINDLALMDEGRYFLSRWMAKWIRKADRFVAISNQIKKELTHLGIPEDKIVFIPNGVEIDTDVKKGYNLGSPAKMIFVGRLNPEKRCDLLIEALDRIREEFLFQLDIFGEGPLKRDLQRDVEKRQLGNLITLRGYQENVRNLLPEYDLFILPSEAEGMSNALLEAMAAGLPCLMSDISPNRELVDPDRDCDKPEVGKYAVAKCGVLFCSGDPEGLADALRLLCKDEEIRRKVGQNARSRVLKDFSIERMAKSYGKLYASLCTVKYFV